MINNLMSLSVHFLKYATMASYLDPKPTEVEVIEAMRYHFPISVQTKPCEGPLL
jgi:hypothetical protein